jgi:hypothetical protein
MLVWILRTWRIARRLHPHLDGLAACVLEVQGQIEAVSVLECLLQADQGQLVVTCVAQPGDALGRQDNSFDLLASQAMGIGLETVQLDPRRQWRAGAEQPVSLRARVLDATQVGLAGALGTAYG